MNQNHFPQIRMSIPTPNLEHSQIPARVAAIHVAAQSPADGHAGILPLLATTAGTSQPPAVPPAMSMGPLDSG